MNKSLPSVYKGKETANNKEENKLNTRDLIIRKKIDDIFRSPSFVYKERVIITTSKGDRLENIIARSNNSILTLNNEAIPINEILDIKLAK